MEELIVKPDEFGVINHSLSPNEVTEIRFEKVPQAIEIETNGDDWIYLTTNGLDPVVGSGKCRHLPDLPSVRKINISPDIESPLVVKIISAGSPAISIERQTRW